MEHLGVDDGERRTQWHHFAEERSGALEKHCQVRITRRIFAEDWMHGWLEFLRASPLAKRYAQQKRLTAWTARYGRNCIYEHAGMAALDGALDGGRYAAVRVAGRGRLAGLLQH